MVVPKIFREYDVRGVWGEDLTGEAVSAIARAFAVCLRQGSAQEKLTVTVGRDVRLSSPHVFHHLSEGLMGSGIDVIDIGTCPTPLQYFSLHHLSADGGIMVTGSHNPPEFNGLKLSIGKDTMYGEKIQGLRRIIEKGDFIKGAGALRKHDIIPDYREYVKGIFGSFQGVKVVVDAGNGTAGLVAPRILRELGCEVIELCCEPDGNFPNHHPDPVVLENIKGLMATVKREGADIGIGYDGDADRIGVVDEDADVVWGDRLMIIFSRDILEQRPGATIIGEVKCSQTLFDDIKSRGGNPIMWKTGHSLIKGKMKESGAVLAGEMSGHLFFADRYLGYDDAIYASLRLIEILSRKGRPYSVKSLLSDVPVTVSTPEIRLDCPDDLKFIVVEKAKEAFRDYPFADIDGIRIQFRDGWGLIRASNTQPALVMRFEAKDEGALERIKGFVEGEVKKLL